LRSVIPGYAKTLDILLWIAVGCCLLSCKVHHKPIDNGYERVSVEQNHGNDTMTFIFQDGDLLFQDLDCGELCDAIEKVTHGINGKNFSHIGLVYSRNDSDFVIEAIGKDVHLTLLTSFVNRNKDEKGNPKIVVGRLKTEFQKLNSNALKFAVSQIGMPYDNAFLYDNQKYYCSELIYDAFKHSNNNQPFFHLEPMTFKDPATGKTFPAWEKYYNELKIAIPEGKPGCNPAGISCSNYIQIVKSFY
ncbi:MAG: hypothetical protein KA444_10515, partial [Bacteroidia bacterium]|nr:hypothetical protein [Bacteroidia bacterium]